MFRATIQAQLAQAIKQLFNFDLPASQIEVETPTLEAFGDYTTNVALKLVKELPPDKKQSPIQIAQAIADQCTTSEDIQSVNCVAPGFINFSLSAKFLYSCISDSLETQLQKALPIKSQDRILIEYIQPNTNKPLHIGHLRNASLGMSLLNLQKAAGNPVVSANLNNDRGIHIIKSMYGYLVYGRKSGESKVTNYETSLAEWFNDRQLWHTPETLQLKSDAFVGKFYILGNTDYEESEKQANENNTQSDQSAAYNQMQQMLIDWESGEQRIRALWKQNNDWFYAGMHQTLAEFGIKSPNNPASFFDKEWYESNIYASGKEIVLEKLGNGVITEFEDGHVEAVLESYNLPNIVLLRKNKTSLYITQDIELMRKRLIEDQENKVVILTGNEQNLRFQQLFAVCESLGIGKLNQMIHFGYGMVRTTEGKMSSRKGNVIGADELIQEVVTKAKDKINQERSEYSETEKDQISNQVAIAAIKYGMLKYNPMGNIIFDIETNVTFEGDTGPYLQYTHARACSIIRKYQEKYPTETSILSSYTSQISFTNDELILVRHLQKYPQRIEKSADSFSPNFICEYLFSLAQKFNLFYANSQIINEQDPIKRQLRLLIVQRSTEVIKHGLLLLGIEAPQKM